MKNKFILIPEITSFSLHILAMIFMLCDHLWGTIISGNDWLTCVGRISFPIFAFLIVEGYFHTGNLRNYVTRLFVFALISEIPFNLAMGSSLFYPVHQNVLWSFLISIGLIHWNEKTKHKQIHIRILVGITTVCIGYIGGLLTFVDFYSAGILTVLVFYFLRGKKWWHYAGQLICMWYIHSEMLGGFGYEVNIFGTTQFIARQSFALLAFVPIWLYKGRQGHHSKLFQFICYAFYPLHLLILGLVKIL